MRDPRHWRGLCSTALIEAERHQGESMTRERRHYIRALAADKRQLTRAAGSHWGIEHSLYRVLDVTFREDDSRLRRDRAPENLNTSRQFAIMNGRQPTPRLR